MPAEVVKEIVQVGKVSGRENIRTILDNTISVPDNKPDISRLLFVDGDIWAEDISASEGRATIKGTVNYRVLYLSEDPEALVKGMMIPLSFTQSVDVPEAAGGSMITAACDIEHISYELSGSRNLSVKTLVNIGVRTVGQDDIQVADHIRGADDVQVLRNSYSINTFTGLRRESAEVAERLELPYGKPSMDELLVYGARITGKEYKISEGRVSIKGSLGIMSLYTGGPDRQLNFVEHEMDFTKTIEAPDMAEMDENANCAVSCTIAGVRLEPAEDSDGEYRLVDATARINVDVEGYVKKNISSVVEAYSPSLNLVSESTEIEADELFSENRGQVFIKEVLRLDNSPEISEIVGMTCKPSASGIRVAGGKIEIDGFTDTRLLYMTLNPELPVSSYQADFSFKHDFEIAGLDPSMNCEAELETESCSYTMVSPVEVEMRVVIGVTARVFRKLRFPSVSNMQDAAKSGARKTSSITVYFCQPGDTLWTIAKRYRTTMDTLKRINNLDGDSDLSSGTQLMIMR